MNKFIFIILFFNLTFSQGIETLGRIDYKLKAKPRQCLLEFECSLILNEGTSLFIWGVGDIEQEECENGVDLKLQDKYGNQVFKNFIDETINLREIIITTAYITKENLPKFNWEIVDEFKDIGKHKVQKATTSFRGRNYIVWFAPNISISDGPWKFNGLPGLILEVYDENLDYVFRAFKIELSKKSNRKINFDSEGKFLQFEDFKKVEDLEFEKIAAMNKAESNMEIEVKKNKSNPLELKYD